MNLLLDTNSLIWFSENSPKLGKNARRLIKEAQQCYVSAASVLEVTIKVMNGKLEVPSNLDIVVEKLDGDYIDITHKHAEALTRFPSLARHDPFDRLLLAQADTEQLTMLTSDKVLIGLELSYVVNARN